MSRGALLALTIGAGVLSGVVCGLSAMRRRLVAVTVVGLSMQPTYEPGDRVLVRRGVVPRRGDVVVVERPCSQRLAWDRPSAGLGSVRSPVTERQWLVKRVAGEPGDPWPSGREETDRVPPGHLLLLGDNARLSFDSRQMGPFPVDRVLGAVWRRL